MGNPSQIMERHLPYGITVLSATQHRWMRTTSTPARQPGTQFIYPRVGVDCLPRWFTCSQTVTHPGTSLQV